MPRPRQLCARPWREGDKPQRHAGKMKRSLPACLPMPIFNQKKRNRQPLTSAPQIKELTSDGTHPVHESFHLPSRPTDSTWESRISQLQNAGKKLEFRSTNICPRNENMSTNFSPKRQYEQMERGKGQSVNGKYPAQLSQKTAVSSYKRSHYSSAVPPGTKEQPPTYFFQSNAKFNKDNTFADMPEEEMIQVIPLYQMTFKEKITSLRIISASIKSMKFWSQYSDRVPLLFEVIATLDSAVTSGDHGSKLFLLRDGKNCVQCIFYEMDQDLPRLIRGRMHRAVGKYDRTRNLMKCVSVRAASVAEQQAFMGYIAAADTEMETWIASLEDTK